MKNLSKISVFISILFFLIASSCKKDPNPPPGTLQIVRAKAGAIHLKSFELTQNIAIDAIFSIEFSDPVHPISADEEILLTDTDQNVVSLQISFDNNNHLVILTPDQNLSHKTEYSLIISEKLKGANGETFPGFTYHFSTIPGELKIVSITLNGNNFYAHTSPVNVSREHVECVVEFSESLDLQNYKDFFLLSGEAAFGTSISADLKTVTLENQSVLKGLTRYFVIISSNLRASGGNHFNGFNASFYTELDSSYKFPEIPDDQLLDLVQEQTFKYFWDFAHPESGLARERNSSGDVVTIGGSGFGVMAWMVGIERGFITRNQGLEQLDKALIFLETCDRFHGAWPHWLNGKTGKVVPFSQQDDGGDLVETAFMLQGLLVFRQYLHPDDPNEANYINRIDTLWHQVEWDWYTNGQQVLYWHWSPNFQFNMNHQIRGHNETLITYVLAASSPTHPVSADAYHKGYASNGAIVNGRSYFGITLPLGWDYGGPLFFAHYSFLGLDPRNLSDKYANYWNQNVAHTLINQAWCINNANQFIGYSADCWGLTASDNSTGYSAHSPTNDRGVITPTAAVASLPYAPDESMRAIRHFYYLLGDKLWGKYGFYDAFDITHGWWADSYLAIDQGPIIVMIENYRSALLWDLFMTHPDVREGLTRLGFTF